MTGPVKQGSGEPRDRLTAEYSTRFLGFEGASLTGSGVLFLAKAAFDLRVGDPPSGGAELLEWRSAERFSLAMTNEILFFAVVLLLPGVIGLYSSLAGFHPRKAAWGCGLVAVVIPVMMALTIVHGRLAFPVYGIDLNDPAVIQLVVSIYYGGQHAAGELLCVATILLALAMRNTPYGRATVVLGFATAIGDFVGAYPWLIAPGLAAASEVLFAGWFIAVGVRLATADFGAAAPLTHPRSRPCLTRTRSDRPDPSRVRRVDRLPSSKDAGSGSPRRRRTVGGGIEMNTTTRAATITRVAQATLLVAGGLTLLLGLVIWTGRADWLVGVHGGLAFLLVFSLWAIAAVALASRVSIALVALAIAWSLGAIVLGGAQEDLLKGGWHWTVQVLHLMVSMGVIGWGLFLIAMTRRKAESGTSGSAGSRPRPVTPTARYRRVRARPEGHRRRLPPDVRPHRRPRAQAAAPSGHPDRQRPPPHRGNHHQRNPKPGVSAEASPDQ
jgi:hypothetical protein